MSGIQRVRRGLLYISSTVPTRDFLCIFFPVRALLGQESKCYLRDTKKCGYWMNGYNATLLPCFREVR